MQNEIQEESTIACKSDDAASVKKDRKDICDSNSTNGGKVDSNISNDNRIAVDDDQLVPVEFENDGGKDCSTEDKKQEEVKEKEKNSSSSGFLFSTEEEIGTIEMSSVNDISENCGTNKALDFGSIYDDQSNIVCPSFDPGSSTNNHRFDPSWDTTKVFFNELHRDNIPKKKIASSSSSSAMNMFDATADWGEDLDNSSKIRQNENSGNMTSFFDSEKSHSVFSFTDSNEQEFPLISEHHEIESKEQDHEKIITSSNAQNNAFGEKIVPINTGKNDDFKVLEPIKYPTSDDDDNFITLTRSAKEDCESLLLNNFQSDRYDDSIAENGQNETNCLLSSLANSSVEETHLFQTQKASQFKDRVKKYTSSAMEDGIEENSSDEESSAGMSSCNDDDDEISYASHSEEGSDDGTGGKYDYGHQDNNSVISLNDDDSLNHNDVGGGTFIPTFDVAAAVANIANGQEHTDIVDNSVFSSSTEIPEKGKEINRQPATVSAKNERTTLSHIVSDEEDGTDDKVVFEANFPSFFPPEEEQMINNICKKEQSSLPSTPTSTLENKHLPLIAPPPEEKLKKWEESKINKCIMP